MPALPAPARLRLLPLAGAVAALLLLGTLLVAGSTGDLTDQQVAHRFVAALDGGDAGDVARLVSDDPTIITWMPVLPRPANSATMALIDVGRADQVQSGKPVEFDAYLGYYQGLASQTELSDCTREAPRPGRGPHYDAWVGCRFASTNALLDAVTGGDAVLRGTVRFGVESGQVRAALVLAEPNESLQPVWEFVLWVRTAHPTDFDRWLKGRLHDPVVSADSAAALRRLAAEFGSDT